MKQGGEYFQPLIQVLRGQMSPGYIEQKRDGIIALIVMQVVSQSAFEPMKSLAGLIPWESLGNFLENIFVP